jgi:hypothetical protein
VELGLAVVQILVRLPVLVLDLRITGGSREFVDRLSELPVLVLGLPDTSLEAWNSATWFGVL